MAWYAVASAAASLVGSYMSSQASKGAAGAQSGAAQAGVDEQRREFDAVQQLLAPYVNAGTGALGAQGDLLGLNGADKQAAAVQALQGSPVFSGLVQQGEQGILANASATGGLRGGNVQGALAQFRPALLSSMISDQFNRLGSLSSLGQNSAVMTGNAAMNTGNSVAQLLQQQGAALAGNSLAQGRIWSNFAGNAAGLGSYYLGRQPQGQNPMVVDNSGGGGIDPLGFLGGPATAGDYSDIRLKRDIVRIGTSPRGHAWYRWKWRADGTDGEGVIAQEVAHVPGAVAPDPETGFLRVDYSKV